MEHKLFIAGEWVESTGGITFEDLNPATGELIGNIHQATNFGRENGRCGIEEMTEVKWITIQSGRRAFPF